MIEVVMSIVFIVGFIIMSCCLLHYERPVNRFHEFE